MADTELINLEFLYSFSDGDQKFVYEMLRLFVENVPIDLKEAETALQSNNLKVAYRHVHSIKSSAKFLGISSLKNLQTKLESQFNAVDKSELMPAFQDYRELIEKAVQQATAILNEQQG